MSLVLRSAGRHANFKLSYQGEVYSFRNHECTVKDDAEARRVAAAHRTITVVGPPKSRVGKPKPTTADGKDKAKPTGKAPKEESDS